MVSLPGDRTESQGNGPPDRPTSPNSGLDWATRIDSDQMFQLIDSILPFEVCLYHQVLPLSVEGSRMNLGMVNPEDAAALDYIRKILAYIKCSLVPRLISSDVHQAMLSAYLSYADKKKQVAAQAAPTKAERAAGAKERQEVPKRPPPPPATSRDSQPTLILDSTEEIELVRAEIAQSEASVAPAPIAPEKGRKTLPPDSVVNKIKNRLQADLPAKTTQNQGSETLILKDEPDIQTTRETVAGKAESEYALPVLEVRATHLSSPIEVLGLLPPKNLMYELLGRVLAGGIGRLFLERQEQQGRILWSQDGVLQSALDNLSPSLFQGVINEFKHLTNLSLLPVQKTKEVEIERLYQGNRLLLRFRFMPGAYGEEATLQVLRGAALKFHQQQQLATLGQDAVGIAKQLQRKLSEITERANTEQASLKSNQDSLVALNQMLMSMRQQLEALEALTGQNNPSKAGQ